MGFLLRSRLINVFCVRVVFLFFFFLPSLSEKNGGVRCSKQGEAETLGHLIKDLGKPLAGKPLPLNKIKEKEKDEERKGKSR